MGARLKTPVSPKFGEALEFASELHAEQARKGTQIPYISHLMSVSALVLEAGGCEAAAIGALLHDAAEDQGGEATLGWIRAKFGPAVEEIVRHCSDDIVAEGDKKRPWRERKQDYIQRLAVTDGDNDALLVSLADKLHNCRAIVNDVKWYGNGVWERFNAEPSDIAWYYASILEIANSKLLDNPLTKQLNTAVWELTTAVRERTL